MKPIPVGADVSSTLPMYRPDRSKLIYRPESLVPATMQEVSR